MIYVHSLSFNLPSETEEATRLLYELNPDGNFRHIIVDLGFPLEFGADIPQDIEKAKERNSEKLKTIAKCYGSEYVKFPNIGVSQNWNQVMKHVNLKDGDVLICADPDERPLNKGWVNAIADVLTHPKMAACALVMPDQKPFLEKNPNAVTKSVIKGHNVFLINGTLSMAQVGFSGDYLIKNGGVPVPDGWGIYGYIENAFAKSLHKFGLGWAILSDYYCTHTECSTLYRAWKDDITSGEFTGLRQIPFEQWLKLQQCK